jgi:Uma2 family endonuclease
MPVFAERPMTARDYFAMPDTEERYELIEGRLVVMPSPTLDHQDVLGRIYLALIAVQDTQGGRAILAPADVEHGVPARCVLHRARGHRPGPRPRHRRA